MTSNFWKKFSDHIKYSKVPHFPILWMFIISKEDFITDSKNQGVSYFYNFKISMKKQD